MKSIAINPNFDIYSHIGYMALQNTSNSPWLFHFQPKEKSYVTNEQKSAKKNLRSFWTAATI